MQEDAPLGRVATVRVGTRNGPKLEAVRSALADLLPDVSVDGASVESGVAEQPVGYPEIVRGARNRARAAHALGCDLAFGIEDGLVELPIEPETSSVFNVGCAVVFDGEREALGFSSGFAYPPAVSEPALRDRVPIGDLFDELWRRERSGLRVAGERDDEASSLTVGNVGKLTLGVLPRSEYARHAVVCALVRFLHPDLYAAREDAARDRTKEHEP